jgi:hypothetical protein
MRGFVTPGSAVSLVVTVDGYARGEGVLFVIAFRSCSWIFAFISTQSNSFGFFF